MNSMREESTYGSGSAVVVARVLDLCLPCADVKSTINMNSKMNVALNVLNFILTTLLQKIQKKTAAS